MLSFSDSSQIVGNSETISPTDDPNLAKCTKNGVLENYDPIQSELADNATFQEFGNNLVNRIVNYTSPITSKQLKGCCLHKP